MNKSDYDAPPTVQVSGWSGNNTMYTSELFPYALTDQAVTPINCMLAASAGFQRGFVAFLPDISSSVDYAMELLPNKLYRFMVPLPVLPAIFIATTVGSILYFYLPSGRI